jgi:hypothetical protein
VTAPARGPRLSQRRIQTFLVLVGVLVVAALVVSRLPRPISGAGPLSQCVGGWPQVAFDGEDWRHALPDGAPRQIPIAEWPSGMRFDETSGSLLDANGSAIFRIGDRVRLRGSVIEVHGDPSPCYYTFAVKVAEIGSP